MKGHKTVLIVEDDSIQSYVLKELVENLNYKVLDVVKTGEEAVSISKEMNFDIILMDITLEGDMDGIDAAKKIQEHSDSRLIYITGNTGDHHRNKAKQTNYVDYLEKPINKKLLKISLERCFQPKLNIT